MSAIPVEPAFDEHRTPSQDLVSECVHCGFCLPSCPTYVLWGEEMDSPRGRIHLMKAVAEGKEPLTEATVAHFAGFLGCMACVPACPVAAIYESIDATPANQQDLVEANAIYRNSEPETIARAEEIVRAHVEAQAALMAIPAAERQAAHASH